MIFPLKLLRHLNLLCPELVVVEHLRRVELKERINHIDDLVKLVVVQPSIDQLVEFSQQDVQRLAFIISNLSLYQRDLLPKQD